MEDYFKPSIGFFFIIFILVFFGNYSEMHLYRRILKCIPIAVYFSIPFYILIFVISEIFVPKMKDKRKEEPCLTQFINLGFRQVSACCYHGNYRDYPIQVSWSEYNHFAKLKSAIRVDIYCTELLKIENKIKKKAEKIDKILILDEFVSIFISINGKKFPEPEKVKEELDILINYLQTNELKPLLV